MKKQRVSPVANFQINPDFGGGTLPQLDEVNRTVAELTGKPNTAATKPNGVGEAQPAENPIETTPTDVAKTQKAAKVEKVEKKPKTAVTKITKIEKTAKAAPKNDTPQYGRPLKEIAIGREKFTTMLQPDLVKSLKRQAIDEGITVADLLENILSEFYNK
ncbi:MAG: hypothetical protein RL757_552 [Bacteroidota bacterium]|jgi:hypothetical protein